MIHTRRALAAALVSGALLVSAACSGGGDDKATPTGTPTTATSPAPSTTAKPKPKPRPKHKPRAKPRNPFRGYGPVPKAPTIAVKLDDTPPGRPQRGIDRADIVYIEAVEGGLTRLAAIYGTYKPIVGWVRSTRPSDPELLLQFGKITEAYSGGAHDSLPRVHRSGIRSWSNDAGAPYYFRVSRYQSSYINLALDLKKVARHVYTPRPRSIGWTFSRKLRGVHVNHGRHMFTEVTGSYQHGTPVSFRYWPRLGKYVRYIGGVAQRAADGQLVAARNVIVQRCRVVAHPQDRDVLGNPSQFTFTVGRGRVSVFRNGKRINGTWSRQRLHGGTHLRTFGGKPIPLAPGNSWVVLIRKGTPVYS